ncbi:3-mercaptopyruvate sulfurtransferase [Serratia rubidaea]|uniref:3-mercaptopyruvate sulfurtransferase n=1 Tax=Serratia rubidaea TaxID=61652 RepID=A0A447QR92_SERRU|nr:3-mercaptopyruvate sulfurtransferase [Serratia rubidaea]
MNSPFLVTPQWLEQHLHDADLVLVDVRMSPPGLTPKKDMQAEFERGHLPGAVYFDIDDVADKHSALPHMLPDAAAFGRAAGELGISENSTLVFYDEGNQFSAPRAGGPSAISAPNGFTCWMRAERLDGARQRAGNRPRQTAGHRV